jgi:hypothetical protein
MMWAPISPWITTDNDALHEPEDRVSRAIAGIGHGLDPMDHRPIPLGARSRRERSLVAADRIHPEIFCGPNDELLEGDPNLMRSRNEYDGREQ